MKREADMMMQELGPVLGDSESVSSNPMRKRLHEISSEKVMFRSITALFFLLFTFANLSAQLDVAVSHTEWGYTPADEYVVKYRIRVTNNSPDTVCGLQVINDVSANYGAANIIKIKDRVVTDNIPGSIFTGADWNTAVTGTGGAGSYGELGLLIVDPNDCIPPGRRAEIRYNLVVDAGLLGDGNQYTNSATATADPLNGGATETGSGSDLSDALVSNKAIIGCALSVSDENPAVNLDGTYDFTYTVTICNYDNDNGTGGVANNVKYNDYLGHLFDNGIPFNSIGVSQVSGPTTLTLQTNYTGGATSIGGVSVSAEPDLIDGGSLAKGACAVFEIDLNVGPTTNLNSYRTTLGRVSCTDVDGVDVEDLSDRGLDPDSNAECGPIDDCLSTRVRFNYTGDVTVDKSVKSLVPAANGTADQYDVEFEFLVEADASNDIQLSNLYLLDDMDSQFCSGLVGIVSPPVVTNINSTAPPAPNTSYDGSTGTGSGSNVDLLAGSSSDIVEPGKSFRVNVTVRIDATQICTNVTNEATVGALDVNGGVVNQVNDVLSINIPPVATNDSLTAAEETLFNGNVGLNDNDANDAPADLSYQLTDGGSAATNGSLVFNADGTFSFTANTAFAGVVSFEYVVCDDGTPPLCDTAIAFVTVEPVNDPPVAGDETIITNEDSITVLSILGNDSDIDGDIDSTTLQIINGPDSGSVVVNTDGTLTYTPNANFSGNDTINYLICDDGVPAPVLCDTGQTIVVVLPVNDPPVAVDDGYGLAEDSILTASVAGNDSDVDNIPSQMTLSLVDSSTAGQNGQIFFNPNGTFTYVPDPGFNGVVSFTYQICDPGPLCDTATVTLNYAGVNDGPIAQDDTTSTNEEVPVTFDPLANDSDSDGQLDTASVQIFGPVNNGTAVVNSDGTITFTPDSNYVGTADFQYIVCDDGIPVICDTATVLVDVLPVNDAPVAANDSYTIDEDTGINGGDLTTNDSDIDDNNADLTWSLLNGGSAAANGTLSVNSDGTFDFTPDPNFNGTVTFDYLLCDDGMPTLCDTATATVFVDPVQDTVVANDDFDNTAPGAVVTTNVIANDQDTLDPGGGVDPGSIIIITSSTNGVDSANANGTISYTPDSNYVGLDSIQYVVCDFGNPLPPTCDTAWFFIDVQTSGILAFDDVAIGTEDSTLTVDILSNDSAGVNGVDTIVIIDPPVNGTLVINPDGTIDFIPDPGWNGTDDFTYQICDSLGFCSNATVNVTINPANDPPVINDDIVNTTEDVVTTIDVLANDDDPLDPLGNIDTTSVVIIGGPVNGTAFVDSAGNIIYTPAPNYNGPDSILYVACDDGNGPPPLCDTATVFINVAPVNDPPVVTDALGAPADTLAYTTAEDTPIIICLPGFDPEADAFDVTGSSNGPSNGLVSGLSDGDTCFTYTPDPDFFGSDSVTIIVCDTLGACDSVVVLINVTPINDAPDANTDLASVGINSMSNGIDVQGNDTDPDGDPLTTTIVSGPTSGGTATVVNDSIVYTPPLGFMGVDTIIYQICDPGPLCDTDTVFVTITLVEICDDGIDNDGNGLIDCLDPACDGFIGCDSIFACTNTFYQVLDGWLTEFDPITTSYDTIGFSGLGAYNAAGYNSEDGYIYGILASNGNLVRVFPDGSATDLGPVGVPPSQTSGDFDESGNLFVTRNTPGADIFKVDVSTLLTDTISPNTDLRVGDFTFDVTSDLFYGLAGNVSGITQHLFRFDPNVPEALSVTDLGMISGSTCTSGYGAAWTDSIGSLYYSCNATGDIYLVNENTLTTSIVSAGTPTTSNDGMNCHFIAPPFPIGPNAVTDFASISTSATNVNIDVAANDTDPNGDLDLTSVVINSGPTSGGSVTVNNDGTITYDPPPGFSGNDTIVYTICDQTLPVPLCDSDTIFISVTNQAPVIVDGGGMPIDTIAVTTAEDALVIICPNTFDADGDSVSINGFINGPSNGTTSFLPNDDTCFVYTPTGNFSGTDTLQVIVCDPFGLCDTAYVIITITPQNDTPFITDDSTSTVEDTPINIDVLLNDNDSNDVGTIIDTNSVVITQGPNNGTATVNPNGTIDYVPDPDFNGVDSLYYVACDNGDPLPQACDTALVIIVVTPVNDAPVITNSGGVPIDTLITGALTGVPTVICINAFDVDGDSLDLVSVLNGPNNGSVVGTNDGDTCFTYTSTAGFLGPDTLTAVVCDTASVCDTVVVIINVTDNDPPIAVNDTTTVVSGSTVNIDVQNNDSDPNGDPLTTSSGASASNGTVVVNPDGTLDYTPNSGFCGVDTISYTVCDPLGLCDSALVFVTVQCAPIALDDAVTTDEDMAVTVDVLINDSDPNGDPITVTSASANNGTVVINMDGTLTYTPDPGFCGTDTIFYTICDITGLCDNAFVIVTVICLNDPPNGTNDTATVVVGTGTVIDVLSNDSDPNGDPLSVDTAYAQNGTVAINADGTLTYTPIGDYCGADTITYVVCDDTPDCDTAYVFIDIPCPPDQVLIPQGFSPNGDQWSQFWVIEGLDEYPEHQLRIFNRWGNMVYSASPYNGDWQGQNNQGELFGDELPVGTYWYVIDLNDEDGTTYSGYVYLNR